MFKIRGTYCNHWALKAKQRNSSQGLKKGHEQTLDEMCYKVMKQTRRVAFVFIHIHLWFHVLLIVHETKIS